MIGKRLLWLAPLFLLCPDIQAMKRPAEDDDDTTQVEEKQPVAKRKRDEKSNLALCRAIQKADLLAFEKLLSENSGQINEKDSNGMYALWYAVEKGLLTVVEKLWVLNTALFDVHAQALTYACACGHEAIVDYILKKAPRLVDTRTKALLFKRLPSDKEPKMGLNSAKATPLLAAAYFGKTDVVKLLLRHHPHLHEKGLGDKTSLCLALEKGHKEVALELIAAGAFIFDNSRFFPEPLRLAVRLGDVEIVKALLQKRPIALTVDSREDLIISALDLGHNAVAEFLIERELGPKKISRCSDILHWMIVHNNTTYISKIKSYYTDKRQLQDVIFKAALELRNIQLLTEILDEDPRRINRHIDWPEKTPLGFVCSLAPSDNSQSDLALLDFLCNRGAELNSLSADELAEHTFVTPLVSVLLRRQYQIALFLLQRGANINAPSFDGLRAIDLCAKKRLVDQCAFLLAQGSVLPIPGIYDELLVRLSQHKALQQARQVIPAARQVEQVAVAKQSAVSIPQPQRSIAHEAPATGSLSSAVPKQNITPSAPNQPELKAHARIPEKSGNPRASGKEAIAHLVAISSDENGVTPLMRAASAGDLNQVKSLCTQRADVVYKDKTGKSAVGHAAAKGFHDIVKELIKAAPGAMQMLLYKEAAKEAIATDQLDFIASLLDVKVGLLFDFQKEVLSQACNSFNRKMIECVLSFTKIDIILEGQITALADRGDFYRGAILLKHLKGNIPTMTLLNRLRGYITSCILDQEARADMRKNADPQTSLKRFTEFWKLLQTSALSSTTQYLADCNRYYEIFANYCENFKSSFHSEEGTENEWEKRYNEFMKFASDDNGQTILMLACIFGDQPIVEKLCKLVLSRAYFNHQDMYGRTALMYALLYGNMDCALTLIRHVCEEQGQINHCGKGINLVDAEGKNALFYAMQAGHYDRPALLIESNGEKREVNALTYSCERGALYILNVLIKLGAKLPSLANTVLALKMAAKADNKEIVVKVLGLCSEKGSEGKKLSLLF